jgi:hypothetical protein
MPRFMTTTVLEFDARDETEASKLVDDTLSMVRVFGMRHDLRVVEMVLRFAGSEAAVRTIAQK